MATKKILLLSRYGWFPTPSRYRFFQYVPYLRRLGFQVFISPLLPDSYVREQYAARRFSLMPIPWIYAKRAWHLLRAGNFDLVWLEKEAFPWIPNWMEHLLGLSRTPYVVDYDDSVFHNYDLHPSRIVRRFLGNKIAHLMRNAVLVLAGNQYLAAYAKKAGARWIEELPSVVDFSQYPPRKPAQSKVFTIGWSGAPPNSRHLIPLGEALAHVCAAGRARLRVLGGWPVDLNPAIPVEYETFGADDFITPTQQFDVGIMPLPNSPWEKGKCGMKLIHYMACGLPTVASPVGVNSQIVEHGVTGFLAETTEEWIRALKTLRDNPSLCAQMGAAGKERARRQFSLEVTAPKLGVWLMQAAKMQPRGLFARKLGPNPQNLRAEKWT